MPQSTKSAPTFAERAFTRPRTGEHPDISVARRVLAESKASRPNDHADPDREVWARYGVLESALEMLLEYVDRQEGGK